MANRVFGYSRISRASQSIDRQNRNIMQAYPSVSRIYQEAYTGTKMRGRKQWEQLMRDVRPGDTIVFDSVSRMSRNAEEGVSTYFELFNKGINLVFLKERTIDTDAYRKALDDKMVNLKVQTGDEATDNFVNDMFSVISKYLSNLAERQIRLAFEQAQKEVDDLHQRTSEGMETAKRNGKRVGAIKGDKYNTKKAKKCKEEILEKSIYFNGIFRDKDLIKILGIHRITFYKYKKELIVDELKKEDIINENV